MNPSALAAVSKVATREPVLRRSEWVLVLYFIYTAFLTILFSLSLAHRAVALAIPALLMAMAHADGLRPRFAVSVARDWLPAPLILVAYWQMDWFRGAPYLHNLERSWLALDRVILHQYKLQAIVESAGYLIPDLLEISYTLVYAIPPLSIAAIYLCHRRKQVDSFLFPFLLGILATYAFLPYFPSASPRLEFPGQDLPAFHGIFRRFNLWILDHGDIHTSVFPSGHVATAFAAAFAMKHALPGRKWLYRGLFIEAVLVTVATIYGRYHYLSDCVAAFALSGCAAGIVVLWERWPNWQPSRRQWRTAACVAAVLSLIPQTAEAGNTLPQLQETRINIRLETDISTYTSRVGDPVRAIVISPVKDGNRILMPRGSVLYGEVRNVTRIGRGFIHERASLKLEFNEWEHSGGIRQHLASRIREVDNAREEIAADGTIHGILAAGGAPGLLLGIWSRPDSVVLARTAAGFAGVSRFLCRQTPFGPAAIAGVITLRFAIVPWPNAEIHLPKGTELTLSAAQLPASGNAEEESQPEPAPDSFVAVASAQPVYTTRSGPGARTADRINLLFLGSREELADAFSAAGWWPAEPLTRHSALAVYKAISAQRGYPTAPMSTLLMDGRPPDLNFQKSFNTVAKRHHIRIWQQPGKLDGRDRVRDLRMTICGFSFFVPRF